VNVYILSKERGFGESTAGVAGGESNQINADGRAAEGAD